MKNQPTPKQLSEWKTLFLSGDDRANDVDIPDAYNYKRVLQEARLQGYMRAMTEQLPRITELESFEWGSEVEAREADRLRGELAKANAVIIRANNIVGRMIKAGKPE